MIMKNCFKNVSVWRQTLATFAAAIGMFNWGNLIGWSNAADLQLRHNETGFGMDDEEGSWVGSTIGFGGIVGSIFAGKLMDIIGRNSSLIFAYSLSLVGWITIACASSVWVICIGRFICGMAAATTALTASVYVGEVVTSKHRGMFGCALAFAQSIGLLYVVVAGEITPNWRITTVACIVPISLGILILFFVPESPYFLAWKNNDVEASRKSIVWILGNTNDNVNNVDHFMGDINEYLQTMRKSIDSGIEISCYQNQTFQLEQDPNANQAQDVVATTPKEKSKRRQSIFNENSHSIEEIKMITMFDVKMILIGSAAMMFSKVCGDSALDYYMVEIFHTTGMDLKPSWATIIVRLAEITSTALSLYLTDRTGRKILLLVSAIGMAIAMCILGAGFSLMDSPGFSENPIPGVSYLPLIGMIVFYLVSPIGFNAIIFVLLGELYSPSIKGIATSTATIIWWLSDFITAKLFFLWVENLGRAGTFYLYAATAVVAFVFVLIFIRETKNKTLAEIQELYKQNGPFQKGNMCNLT